MVTRYDVTSSRWSSHFRVHVFSTTFNNESKDCVKLFINYVLPCINHSLLFGLPQMCITGALGIPGSGRERSNTRNSFVSKTLLCLALLLPNGLNMMLTIPFNLKLPGGILYYSFLFINIYFFPGRRFHGFLYHIRRVWWNNHPFLQHWHLPDHLERPEVLL